jgi:ABC-type transporter Mla MlaB component
LKLTGDFDRNSSYELINTIEEQSEDFYEICIDTNDLKRIYPFGKELFQKKLNVLQKKFHSITFLGRNGGTIGIP